MTTATFHQDSLTAYVLVNGRRVYVRRITALQKQSTGKWSGMANGYPFFIEGGKAAGGRRTDWYVDCYDMTGLTCSSMVSAIKLIESA